MQDFSTIVFNARMLTCPNIQVYLTKDTPQYRAHFYATAAQDQEHLCVAEACWLPQ